MEANHQRILARMSIADVHRHINRKEVAIQEAQRILDNCNDLVQSGEEECRRLDDHVADIKRQGDEMRDILRNGGEDAHEVRRELEKNEHHQAAAENSANTMRLLLGRARNSQQSYTDVLRVLQGEVQQLRVRENELRAMDN